MDDFLLTFDDAKRITNQMVNFFNSTESDQTLLILADKFKLDLIDGFRVHVDSIEQNCKNCSGCHFGSCTLGCMFEDKGKATVCYWDTALEKIIGTKVIKHEMGHIIHEQVFVPLASQKEQYDRSERFAQFVENSLNLDMNFSPDGFNANPEINKFQVSSVAKDVALSILVGLVIAVGVNGIFYLLEKRYTTKLITEK